MDFASYAFSQKSQSVEFSLALHKEERGSSRRKKKSQLG